MRKYLLSIILFLCLGLAGCRASREVHTTQQRHQSSKIDVEAHRLDSLWSILVERYHVHVEFFNPNEVRQPNTDTTGNPLSLTNVALQVTDPYSTKPADGLGLAPSWGGIGGLGSVKSIDIEAERTQSEQSLSQADSTAVFKTESDEARQTEKASEARQDNGTWIIVSVVAAVTILIFLFYLTRRYLKK